MPGLKHTQGCVQTVPEHTGAAILIVIVGIEIGQNTLMSIHVYTSYILNSSCPLGSVAPVQPTCLTLFCFVLFFAHLLRLAQVFFLIFLGGYFFKQGLTHFTRSHCLSGESQTHADFKPPPLPTLLPQPASVTSSHFWEDLMLLCFSGNSQLKIVEACLPTFCVGNSAAFGC